MTPTDRNTLKAIIATLEAATALEDFDAHDLGACIDRIGGEETGELADLLFVASWAVTDIEDDEDSEFEDSVSWAVAAIKEALDYRAPKPRKAKPRAVVTGGVAYVPSKDGKGGAFVL